VVALANWKLVKLMGPDGTVVNRVTALSLRVGQTVTDRVTGQRMTVLAIYEAPS
jgi:hypothetical protein